MLLLKINLLHHTAASQPAGRGAVHLSSFAPQHQSPAKEEVWLLLLEQQFFQPLLPE